MRDTQTDRDWVRVGEREREGGREGEREKECVADGGGRLLRGN